MIKACIFDLDGTLADTLDSITYSANTALTAVGLPVLDRECYKYFAGDGAKTLLERTLKAAGGEDAMKYYEQAAEIYNGFFKENCTYKVKVFEGMKDVILSLRARKIHTAVLSNKPHERTVDVINKLFGPGYFDIVRGQSDHIPKKPDPVGAVTIARELQVECGECMYIGDTNVDMMTGNRAGMYTVGVLWGFRDRKELEEHNAHVIIHKPEEILHEVRTFK